MVARYCLGKKGDLSKPLVEESILSREFNYTRTKGRKKEDQVFEATNWKIRASV